MLVGDRNRLIVLASLLIISLLLLTGCFLDMKKAVEIVGDNREQVPVRSLEITMAPSHQEQLFDQFRKFSDEHDLELIISDYNTGGETYLVEMLGDDIKVIAMHSRHDPDIVFVGFYDETRATTTSDETLAAITELAIDLEYFIKQIPDVTIVEQ